MSRDPLASWRNGRLSVRPIRIRNGLLAALVAAGATLLQADVFANETEPAVALAPSLTGDTGVLRAVSARTGNVGFWDIGAHGMYFQQRGFIAEDDYDEFTGAFGSISWAPLRWLELYSSSTLRENFNSTADPNLDHANGAIQLGLKLSAPITGWRGPVWLALRAGTRSPPNVDKIQFRGDTFGAEVTGIFTFDMTERLLPGTSMYFPLRIHGNFGYIYDRSGILRVPEENPARTFALDLHDRNRTIYAAAIEFPFRYATPFFEISGANPNGVPPEARPSILTPGVRITPIRGLALDLAVDIGRTTERVDGLPMTPKTQFTVGASYAFASQQVYRERFEESGELTAEAKRQIAALKAEVEAEKVKTAEIERKMQRAMLPAEDAWLLIDRLEGTIKEAATQLKQLDNMDGVSAGDAALRALAAARRAQEATRKGSIEEAMAAAAEAEAAAKEAEAAALRAKASGDPEVIRRADQAAMAARRIAELTRQGVTSASVAMRDPQVMELWQIAREEAIKADNFRKRLGDTEPVMPVSGPTANAAAAVLKAVEAGEKGNLAEAELSVVQAEKEAAKAVSGAQAIKKDPSAEMQKLSRPAEVTSGSAKKAAVAARNALDNSRRVVGAMASKSGGRFSDAAFRGVVLDSRNFAPIGDAIVSFPDTNLSRILADANSGFFRSYTFPPGLVNVAVTKTGYETLLQPVTIKSDGDPVVKFLLKKEGKSSTISEDTPGIFKGNIVDDKGQAVAATLSFPDAPFTQDEIPTTGAFSLKLPPGLYQVDAKAPGFLLQGRRISVGPGETVVYDFVLRPIPKDRRAESEGNRIALKDVINFATNRDVIQADSFSILDEVTDIILSNPDYKLVRVEGHTDDVGGAAYNLALSDRRAKAVVNYLVNKGVPPERVQAVGWGKAKPMSEGTDETARALNRRVEFNILKN